MNINRIAHELLHQSSFRRQLSFAIAGALFLLALSSALVTSWETSRQARVTLIAQGQRVTENLARQSTLALLFHSSDNAREAVAATLAFPDVEQVEIENASHVRLLTKSALHQAPVPTGGWNTIVPVGSKAVLIGESDQEWYFAAAVYGGDTNESPFDVEEHKPQLLGYVHVVLGKQTLDRWMASLFKINLGLSFSFAAFILLLTRQLTRRLTQPLSALSELMRRARAGEAGVRAELKGPRDIHDMADAFNSMLGVLEDRETELKQSRDIALRTALLKAQFAATVSHELRTPLNGLVGMLDLARETSPDQQQSEYLEVAHNSARQLMELINDVLDFSKMEAGKVDLEQIDFSVRAEVEEVIELLARPAHQKQLELGYLLAAEVPERIQGDPRRLRQVLINLLGNAIKFTDHGQVVVRIAPTPGSRSLTISVTDSGIGIRPEALAYIFDSYSQADRSTTRHYGGTGLGLAICRQLVELMGGTINVRSTLGAGSTFYFTMAYQPATGNSQPDTPPLALTGLHVLIVDSSDLVSQFLEQSLALDGISCRVMASGPLALVELQHAVETHAAYDLMIFDAGMTDERGYPLGQVARQIPALTKTRLLVLQHNGGHQGAPMQGADASLSKPLRLDRLRHALHNLFAAPAHAVAAPSHKEERPASPQASLHVLVAEDNRTNQLVASGMLKTMGCTVEFAGNGREAVEALRARHFDLVLMDCNMPEMDGYEATAHIRNDDDSRGRHTPIVAMTANTQHGDTEKCLAVGMDDYLAKPITLAELRKTLRRWLEPADEPAAPPAKIAETPQPENGPLDMQVFTRLRNTLGSSLHLALAPFLEDTAKYLEQMEQALAASDAKRVHWVAHAIKGSSANLGATELSQLAKTAEDHARSGDLVEVAPLLPLLHAAFAEIEPIIAAEAEGSQQEQPHGFTRPIVLVVDDDRSTRSALRHTLQRDGFQVEEAVNGALALEMVKRMVPDVILMDAVMPVMDGFTACAQLQTLPGGRQVPVLMITALEDTTSVERAFAAGASDYIPKPIHFAVLSQRIRRIIDANRAESHIRHLAYYDALTGLPNRVSFLNQLAHDLEQAHVNDESLAVLFLDLDRFKYVNDTLGHETGDRLLVAVAQRIRGAVRNADTVARLGGDEFTVVLAGAASSAATTAAHSICRALAEPFAIDGREMYVNCSVGISLFPSDGRDVSSLLKHADTAMYRAKKTNSGVQFFEPSMEQTISEHLQMENELRRALERNELELFYQPKADFNTGLIVGMEALVRWRHPQRGLISPLQFIPLAEETGLIAPIGAWVLRTACIQAKKWQESGLVHPAMAVNLSARQLLRKDIVQTVEATLKDTGLPPELLELEITESTLMEHAQDTLEILERLRSMGVCLAIDDFGTGYSSLAYLKRFPVQTLKIDRSFVCDVTENSDDAAIATGIIALAHSLRLKVVAEGVETIEQHRFLHQRGCDIMQGYLLSRPLPLEEFEQFARDYRITP